MKRCSLNGCIPKPSVAWDSTSMLNYLTLKVSGALNKPEKSTYIGISCKLSFGKYKDSCSDVTGIDVFGWRRYNNKQRQPRLKYLYSFLQQILSCL